MDDSDQDFSFLCSRLLKRVRRKGGESGDEKKTAVKLEGEDEDSGPRIQSRCKAPSKRKRLKKGEVQSKNTEKLRQDEGPQVVAVKGEEPKEQKMRAKEAVLGRMQRFKRASPPRLVHAEERAVHPAEPVPLPTQVEKQDGDRLMAQRLQKQLDGEAVEDGGLFFCQLCYKDLSAMNHRLRTQHINRCLDEHESSTSRVPAPVRPRIPDCPICGRGFKSEKSRSTHLKRCSANMGVSPAELLKALQRQAAEQDNRQQAAGSSDTSDSSKPAKKRARKKECLDEDTMVALALSRSLLEQEKREMEERRVQSGPTSLVQGKNRVKRRKGDPAAPPPLLLVQDPQTAHNRIQERVASLLLHPRPPTPPTPTLSPSPLFTNALLWLKSALPGGGPASLSEFHVSELKEFMRPEISENQSAAAATPVKPASGSESVRATEPLGDSAPHRPITPSLGTPGTQALTDLMDLAEDGMTLTQYKSTDADPPLSGFVPEPTDTPRPPIISTSVSRLCSDLSSMLNNPQLSDVQLQVDSGDVYFVHSFMLYSRCPLLANMVHDAGFGVREEGFPQARRVLLNDVSGEAVYALLQYLYTAVCHLTHSLLSEVLQLASRFGLSELQQQCERYTVIPELTEQERGASPGHECVAEPQQGLVDTQFLELLRSMWEHEEVDNQEVGGSSIAMQSVGGEGEAKDDVVDEDELDEIYQFAATQRKMGTEVEESAERGSEEEEADEGVEDARSGAEEGYEGKQDVEMEDARCSAEVELNLESRGPDTSLDRSYNHLFSESWGEYTEPSRTQTRRSDATNVRRVSSVSEVIDLSVSPPPETEEPARSQFPVAGLSPGEASDQNEAVQQASTSGGPKAPGIFEVTPELKLEVTKPKLYSSSPSRSQPELIVLSDSSDDMEPDLPNQVPSHCEASRPPNSSPSRLSLSYTPIKAKETVHIEFSPNRSKETPSSIHPESSGSDQVSNDHLLDGSAEVSWLIPATPVPSVRTGSTQTCGGMRRTQLFPGSRSSSSSSVSDNPQSRSCSNSLTEKPSQPTPSFQKLPYLSRSSKTSHSDSVNRTDPYSVPEFCSSTPLHSDPPRQQLDPLGSPLLGDVESRTRLRSSHEGKLESLHLSPSENSLSPRRGCRSEKESSSFSSQHTNAGDHEVQEMGAEEPEAVKTRISETNEVPEERFSFVLDEPPIAFDDSWGLGGAVGQQGPQFSLRLESSGDQTSSPEESGKGGTASLRTFSSPPGARGNLPEPEAPLDHSSAMWDSWVEGDEEEEKADTPPLPRRVGSVALTKRVAELRTPVACKKKPQAPLVPITPMPGFSDMDTPELKNRLNRFGVRPLPKKQMVLKLKEIHQYTHQLMSSSSEEETSPKNRLRAAAAAFKQPTAPPPVSPRKLQFGTLSEEHEDELPASQDSNTSTAESERSNPEMCDSDEDVSDSEGITASQAVVREKDKLQAVRSFILSDPVLYGRVLQYQPLVLSELKAALRVAGVRLGTAKLLDFLDSQCITFTTAKQGHPAPSRRRARGAGRGRKKTAKAGD